MDERLSFSVQDRCGLVDRCGRVRRRAEGTPLFLEQRPNELWYADYRCEFALGIRQC